MLELKLADQVADLPALVLASSGLEWQFYISTVRFMLADQLADLPPKVLVSSGQEWQFYISTVRVHICISSGRSTPHYWHLVVYNGNFTFLLLEFILADQLADLPPKVLASSGQE